MKVARSALPVTLAHWERAGVRETVIAAGTDFVPYWFSGVAVRGGADAMAVSQEDGTAGERGADLFERPADKGVRGKAPYSLSS
jgi:hypothetical protein